MKAKPNRVSKKFVFGGFLLIACCLQLLNHQVTYPAQSAFRRIFHWPLLLGHKLPSLAAPQLPAGENPHAPHALASAALQAQMRALENHRDNLMAELHTAQLQIERLSGLRSQLGLENIDLIYANALVSVIPGQLIINRGRQDGVIEGLYAIFDNAIIGRIVNVALHEATLLLITHPDSSIAVSLMLKTQDTQGPVGKLDGLGNGKMPMINVRRSVNVQVGDTVHVREQPGILDTPLIIGRVAQVEIDQQHPTLSKVIVEPAAHMDRITWLSVVRLKPE
ncbi:rod shape-determining protein MreC [Planctomycetota bacterium]